MVPTSASFDTNISHAIGLEIQPEFESEQTVLHPKSGPQILNALRSPMRNWRRGEWLTNYPNSWNPKATVSRAWPER